MKLFYLFLFSLLAGHIFAQAGIDSTETSSNENDMLGIVEEMPRFVGCEHITDSASERSKCAQEKLLKYIYGNLKYPALARENNNQGTVVVQFVVDTIGMIQDLKVVRDNGGECGQAVIDVFNKMSEELIPPYIPGKQRGIRVKVMYTFPVKFSLGNNKKSREERKEEKKRKKEERKKNKKK